MTRHGIIVAALLLGTACTDLVTVDVGAPNLEPVVVERDLPAGPVDAACAAARGAVEGTVVGRDVDVPDGACLVVLRSPNEVLVERAFLEANADELARFDPSALVGIDVEILELELGIDPLGVRLSIDGRPLVTDLEERQRVALPQSLVARFREALVEPADVRADLELRVVIADPGDVPETVRMRLVFQPILRVDAVRAAL